MQFTTLESRIACIIAPYGLECLIATARDHDPHFDGDAEQSWRQTLRFGIDFVRERY